MMFKVQDVQELEVCRYKVQNVENVQAVHKV